MLKFFITDAEAAVVHPLSYQPSPQRYKSAVCGEALLLKIRLAQLAPFNVYFHQPLPSLIIGTPGHVVVSDAGVVFQ